MSYNILCHSFLPCPYKVNVRTIFSCCYRAPALPTFSLVRMTFTLELESVPSILTTFQSFFVLNKISCQVISTYDQRPIQELAGRGRTLPTIYAFFKNLFLINILSFLPSFLYTKIKAHFCRS